VLAGHLAKHGADAEAHELRRIRGEIVEKHFAVAAAVHPDIDMRAVYRELIDAVLPGNPDRDRIADDAAWAFREAATEYRTTYDGTHEALAELRETHTLAIASNTQRVYTERELAAEALDEYFDVIVFS